MAKKPSIFYTDGSCLKNPGNGGWSCVELVRCEEGYKTEVLSGNSKLTTNNEMELTAAYYAILKTYKRGGKSVVIYSDSAYVANTINRDWLINWKNNGWRTGQDKPVKNKNIWEKIYKLIHKKKVKVNVIKVKGHSGDILNEFADEIARGESKKLNESI